MMCAILKVPPRRSSSSSSHLSVAGVVDFKLVVRTSLSTEDIVVIIRPLYRGVSPAVRLLHHLREAASEEKRESSYETRVFYQKCFTQIRF